MNEIYAGAAALARNLRRGIGQSRRAGFGSSAIASLPVALLISLVCVQIVDPAPPSESLPSRRARSTARDDRARPYALEPAALVTGGFASLSKSIATRESCDAATMFRATAKP